jgi:hypothetical protein
MASGWHISCFPDSWFPAAHRINLFRFRAGFRPAPSRVIKTEDTPWYASVFTSTLTLSKKKINGSRIPSDLRIWSSPIPVIPGRSYSHTITSAWYRESHDHASSPGPAGNTDTGPYFSKIGDIIARVFGSASTYRTVIIRFLRVHPVFSLPGAIRRDSPRERAPPA